jgi:hippurate hydrolase
MYPHDADPDTLLLARLTDEIGALRRDLHAHPETAFEERRTARRVADTLKHWGIETHEGIGRTGVVAVLRRGDGPCVGLRADMDALPLKEENDFAHRSVHEGKMHACGHDGHTAMLLGAARWLQLRGRFAGTVCCIFQPAEETGGGAGVMLEDGLLARFPITRFFGLHNWPGLPAGSFALLEGPVMAAADEFEIVVEGKGAHGAMPHLGADPIVAGSALVQALQSIVTRQLDPLDSAVISVTRFNAGHAYNVIPQRAVLGGTARSFNEAVRDALESSMRRMCAGISQSHGVTATLRYTRGYPATVNEAGATALCRAAAEAIGASVLRDLRPSMGAEDFSMFAQQRPACYGWIGNGPGLGGCTLHSPHYDFNDILIATGIRYWTAVTELALPV